MQKFIVNGWMIVLFDHLTLLLLLLLLFRERLVKKECWTKPLPETRKSASSIL